MRTLVLYKITPVLVIVLSVTFGCSNIESSSDENKSAVDSVKVNSIIGTWLAYASKDLAGTTMCNACPIISFANDGSARVEYPSKVSEEYLWHLTKDTLYFSLKSGKQISSDSLYFQELYTIEYPSQKNDSSLVLTSVRGKYSYLLGRN